MKRDWNTHNNVDNNARLDNGMRVVYPQRTSQPWLRFGSTAAVGPAAEWKDRLRVGRAFQMALRRPRTSHPSQSPQSLAEWYSVAQEERHSIAMDALTWLARLLHQTDQDTSRLSLARLVQMREYSSVFWHMRTLGEQERAQATLSLYKANGAPYTPNPRAPVPFSLRSLIAEVARQHNITCEKAQEYHRGAIASLRGGDPTFAFIITQPNRRPAHLVADLQMMDGAWTWHAAMVLGIYVVNEQMLSGFGLPGGDWILPPDPYREASLCALTHQFAKGLLASDEPCPLSSPCACNRILSIYDAAPPQHPQMTGELRHTAPPPHLRPARPTTPFSRGDTGERLRAWRKEHGQDSDPGNGTSSQPTDPTLR